MTTESLLKKTILLTVLFLQLLSLKSFASTSDPFGNVQQQYELLQKELSRYEEIERKGGWKKITPKKKFYQTGQSDAVVLQIKQRLQVSGELSTSDHTPDFNEELAAAVKKVQHQFGHPVNGVVDAQLIKELNITVEKRIEQLLANIDRLQNMQPITEGTRLVANIPEFKLFVYEGNKLVFDMDVVVGTSANKTVIFNDEMEHIVFSPYWNVPPSIVKNEILPAMRGNRSYLWRHNYVQTGTENGLPVIRQMPGPKNSLGLVKFVFPNSHNIYFHDTPAKSLFQLPKRAFSHGCIRLKEPEKLAEYLLRNDNNWTSSKINQAMNAGKEQWVKLDKKIPVAITYITAWVDQQGQLNFREDIYGHDKNAGKRLAKAS